MSSRGYTIERLKTDDAVCLFNYRSTGRASYLDRAIRCTREALALCRK